MKMMMMIDEIIGYSNQMFRYSYKILFGKVDIEWSSMFEILPYVYNTWSLLQTFCYAY